MEENKKVGLYNSQQDVEESSSLNLQLIYKTLVLNWQWFVLSVIICLGIAFAYLRYTTPMYQASAKLLIKDDDNQPTRSGKSALLASNTLGIMSNSTGIDNEMEILKSTRLAEQTCRDLKLYVTYKVEGRVKTNLVYGNEPISADIDPMHLEKLKNPVSLEITSQNRKYHITGQYTTVSGSEENSAPVKYSIDRTADRMPYTINTSIGIITLKRTTAKALPDGKAMKITIMSPSMTAIKYANSLSVSQTSKTTTIAQLVLNDEIPQRAIDYLKQLSVCYNRQANEDKNEIALRTEQFINTRLEKINSELGQTEGSLESTKRHYRIVDPKINSTTAVTNTETFNQKLAEMNTQIQLLYSISEYLNEPSNKYQTLPSNVGLTDPTSATLINKYNEIVMQRNRLLRTASETSPAVIPLTAQLDELISSIRRAMTQAQRNNEIQRNSIQQQFNTYANQIASTPEQERILTQIGRQQEVKSGLYLMLLQKREENSISLAATADKGKLIDEPQFGGKISPKSAIIMLVALILGLAIPVGILFIINFLRYKIEGHDDVANLTSLPIIGDIAIASDTAKTKADIVVHENKNNLMEEIFRSLRVNIQFQLPEDKKTIMFTSTTSGEGKTFTAANVAVSFALLDKKVVLIGLDIRKPRLAELFEIDDHRHGITNLLTKSAPTEADVNGQIVQSGINKNLDILMAGPIPPNPTELVSRNSLDMIFEILKSKYDYIIIDTAPVGLVTDTLQIARVADMTVYICRADYTAKSSFDLINGLSSEKKLPNIAIAINGIDMAKKKYGYYYGYGKYGKYGKYAKYGNYGKNGSYSSYGNYGKYGAYGSYGSYYNSSYGDKNDTSIKV